MSNERRRGNLSTPYAPYGEMKKRADMVRSIDLQEVLNCIYNVNTALTSGLRGHQHRRHRYDKYKWHTPQGMLSVTSEKFINWTTGVGGGGAIDLVIHLMGYDFKTAVNWLWRNVSHPGVGATNHQQVDVDRTDRADRNLKTLKLPKRVDGKLPQIFQYLTHQRCLPQATINHLIRSGMIYADNKSNAVFLLLGKEKTVVGAELRGTTTKRWRGMATGSRKDLGCFYIKRSHTNKMVLCESAIDALSCFALNRDFIALSTSGANPNPAWLTTFINKGFEIYCGFDADEIGDSHAEKMMRRYPSVIRLRPIKHDWNEILQSKYHTCQPIT
jgi:hypothetical protein